MEMGACWKWSTDNIEFVEDKENSTNRLMSLTANTNGSAESTIQSQIYHKRNYLEGTYAVRVFFKDSPISNGIEGDYINETFFAISSLAFDLDPNCSELDFAKYLLNGGWGNKVDDILGNLTELAMDSIIKISRN
jgi:hypothetical protein